MKFGIAILTALGLLVLSPHSSAADDVLTVDPKIKKYQPTSGVAGNLNSVGSDTLNNLMTLWAEGFRKRYPNVRIQIEGKGSSTAPPALIQGASQLGPMSRETKASEVDEFVEAFGYKPTRVRVAIDALAVYVNKDNPLERLSLPQVDAAFSKTRRLGEADEVATWGDLGATGEWASKPISLYGRNSASGTYGFFKKTVLGGGDYKDVVKEQPGSASVVQGVTEDRFGIGYSGIGYRTSGVKVLSLAAKAGQPYGNVSPDSVYGGNYPLARFLYVYVNRPPNQSLDPMIREFLKFVMSQEGQQIVLKDGYFPLSASIVDQELGLIE